MWVTLSTRFYASALEAQPGLHFMLPLGVIEDAVYLTKSASDKFSKLILMGATFDRKTVKNRLISIKAKMLRHGPESEFSIRIDAKRCIIIDALLAQI